MMPAPRVTSRPPSPFVPAGKNGCCKCHVARVYALMVGVSIVALLLFLLVPWAASHGATHATAGDAVAVAEAGGGGRVRGRGRGPQSGRRESWNYGGIGGNAESAMRMGGGQADMTQEKAAPMILEAADAVASSAAAVDGDDATGGGRGEAEAREAGVEGVTDEGESKAGGAGMAEGEVPMPLKVYMVPLAGELNFHVLLQRWRFADRPSVPLHHGLPPDWQFQGNSLRARNEGDVEGFLLKDDGWMEGGEREGEGGGGGGGKEVQVPRFVEGFGVHIEQYAAEYWLTLSLLSGGLPSVQRVRTAEEAHIIFVPAFSSAFYAAQMKTNERRRRAGDTQIPEEQRLLAAVTQHPLWVDGGGQGQREAGGDEGEKEARGVGGAEGEQGQGTLLEEGEVASGEGSAGAGREVGGSRRLLRAMRGDRQGEERGADQGGKEGEGQEKEEDKAGAGASVEGAESREAAVAGVAATRAAAATAAAKTAAALASRRRDFLIPAVHPHALSTVRHELAAAHMLMADFSQPAESVAHLGKDVIVPYSALIPPFLNDSLPGEGEGGGEGTAVEGAAAVAAWAGARPTFIFFRGTLNRQQGGRIRGELARLLANTSGADIAEGSPLAGGVQAAMTGMRSSRYCLVPEGDTASSCRLFDAILSHCIPLVVSDSLDLPFEEALDYTRFALFLPQALALRPGYVEGFLRNVTDESAFAMWKRLREVAQHFVYSSPPKPGGAEDMIWQAVARRWAGDHHGRGYNGENQSRRRRAMERLLEREGLGAADIVVRPRALPLF